jgi:pyroglutamyl-peptidase
MGQSLRRISLFITVLTVSLLISCLVNDNSLSAQDPKPSVLITGFGPFQNITVNPSWVGARQLDGEVIEGHEIVAVELPVDFRKVSAEIPLLIKKHNPQVVVHFGVYWPGDLRFEQRARNKIGRTRDVSGYYPEDRRVTKDGPMIYRSRLPESELMNDMPEAGYKMVSSDDAGRYVCEFTFYTQLYNQDKLGKDADAGFIHVAPLEQPLNSKQIGLAMREIIRICLKNRAKEKAETTPLAAEPSSRPASRPANTNERDPAPVNSPGMTDALRNGE